MRRFNLLDAFLLGFAAAAFLVAVREEHREDVRELDADVGDGDAFLLHELEVNVHDVVARNREAQFRTDNVVRRIASLERRVDQATDHEPDPACPCVSCGNHFAEIRERTGVDYRVR